jgi:hypothetical protein
MVVSSSWRRRRAAQKFARDSLADISDHEFIAAQLPELLGMDELDAIAYSLQKMDEWEEHASPEQAAELASRLIAINAAFEELGGVLPFWANLWVLRTLQAEDGLNRSSPVPPA